MFALPEGARLAARLLTSTIQDDKPLLQLHKNPEPMNSKPRPMVVAVTGGRGTLVTTKILAAWCTATISRYNAGSALLRPARRIIVVRATLRE